MVQISLSTSTNFDGNSNALAEDLSTELTISFTLDEPAPEGGLRVFVDSDVAQIINRLDLPTFAFNPVTENINPATITTDFDNSGVALTIDEGATAASFAIPIFDNPEPDTFLPETFDGLVEATLAVRTASEVSAEDADNITDISEYTVDSNAGSSVVIFADDASQLSGDTPEEPEESETPVDETPTEATTGDAPVVNFSTDVTTLTESENSIVTFNFSVDGEIPSGGLPISLNVDASDPTWFFDLNNASRPSVNPDIGSFDSVAILGREIVGIDGGRVISRIAPPDFNVLDLVVTENEASFQVEIFDDVFAEENETIAFTLEDGEGYTSASSEPVTLTLQDSPDGIVDGTSPQVSIAVDRATVAEGESLTVNLSVDGEIPEGGLTVFVDGSSAGALSEFAVDELETKGLTGAPGPNADAGGFVVTLIENEASITLPVFKDGLGEGVEEFTFNVADGELYDPNPEASSASLTIEETPPVISVGLLGGTFVENELITPNLVESTEEGIPILSLVLQSDAPVPEEGLVVNVNTDLADITQFVNEAQFSPTTFGGQVIGAIYNDQGVATGLRVRMDNPNTVVNFQSGVGFAADGAQDVTFSVEEAEGYTSSGESASITVYDTLDQVPEVTATPEIGISIEEQERPLSEGRGAITLNFTVEGEIPPEGVVAYVATGEFAGLGDFDLLNAGVDSGLFPTPDGQAGGFFFRITEPEASITIQAAEDETDEGIETIDLALQPLPGYTIAEDAGDISVQLRDGRGSEIQVALESEPEILIEEEGTVANFTLSLSSAPPESGITIVLNSENLTDFNAEGLEVTGGGVASIDTEGTVSILVTEQTATVTVPVNNDGVAEGKETAVFTLAEPGEEAGYQISSTEPETRFISFDIYDTVNDSPVIVESEESDDTIETAIPITINSERSSAIARGEIDFDFGNNREVDQTEDVDMYSVELQAGDRLTLDLDSIPFENSEGFTLRGGGDLRLFNEVGEELVYNAEGSAPGEILANDRDAFIDFTVETAGTYYIGVSQTFNEDYDPNVKGTGDGAILPPRFGIGAGEYELNVDINPEEPTFEQFVEFEGESNADAPTISFTAVPGTFSGDDIVSNQIIESLGVGRGQAALVNFTLEVDGEIPESGIEVIIKSDTDFTGFLDDLTGTPRTAVGAEVLGAIYNEDGSVAGLRALITSNNVSLPFPVLEREDDDPDAPESIEFSLANSADYVVDSELNTSNINFFDTLEQVQSEGDVPQVGVTIDQTELIESEGTEVNLSFNVDGEIPEGGLLVYVNSETRASLGEFDVFNAEITGGAVPAPNGEASGFYFLIQENTANIKLNVFDETTNELIPEEDALEGIEEFSFSIVESDGYTIDAAAAGFSFTIADNPDSVVIEQPEEPGEGKELPEVPTDNDGRSSNNDTIANAVPLGLDLASDNLAITIDGEIADRFRGTEDTVDNTEDVDIYSFDLQEGQTITIDIDATGIGDAGLESILDSNLRIFDAEGTELELNEQGAAPDEIFQAEGDPYLEFTAPETGTYYAGISALGNDFYDPNVVASGSGWTFGERFGADIYQVTFSLGEQLLEPPTEMPSEPADEIDEAVFDFTWTGQIAGFGVEGQFSYDASQSYTDGIVREEDLLDFDISFFDPEGNLLRTYEDNHLTFPEFNFAYDNTTNEILQDGYFLAEDGFNVGEKTAVGEDEFTGLNFWSRPEFNSQGEVPPPHLHIDDWSGEFGFPLGFSSHEDVAFLTRTTQQLLDTGRVGETYIDQIQDSLDEIGQRIEVRPAEDTTVEPPTSDLPVVSLIIEPEAVSEEDAPVTTNFTFSVEGEIPEGGLPILFGGEGNDLIEILDQLDGNFPQELIGMESLGFFPAQGAVGLNLLENEAVLTRTIANDLIEEADRTFVFNVVPNDEGVLESEYIVSPETGSDSLTLTDDNGGVGVGPTVGFSVSDTELTEGDEFTINFSVDGEIHEDGLPILVSGSEEGLLGEFSLFNADGSPAFTTTGIDGIPEIGDSRGSSFIAVLAEPDASITVSTSKDNIAEESEELSFALVNGEEYEVAPDAGEVTFSISDVVLDGSEPVAEAVFDFTWTGQIAGFGVEGQFSFDANQSYIDGIVREEDLLDFDISFFDPEGNLLRTYEDNHLTFPEFNFAYDTTTNEILQDGYFLAEDGFNVGEKTAVGEDEFTGLNFWSRPEFNSQGEVPPPHLHIDDWSGEFGFPLGFSSHEDVAFLTRTTQQLLDTGRVGETYIDDIQDSLDEIGHRIEVTPVEDTSSETETIVTVDFSTTTFIEELGNTEPGALESPQSLTVTFTVEGEIDEEAPPVINFASSEPDGLTRFSLTELEADNLIPMADVANFEFTDADITLLAPTSSFTVPVFNLPDDTDLDGDGIIEDFADTTETVQFTITSVTDGVSINPETEEFTGTFFETIADAEGTGGGEGDNFFDPIFGSIDADTIEITGGDGLIFAGDSDDLIDLTQSDGNNRAYGGSSDDILVLGEGDRILAGEGDDAIFATSGGDNTITGGAGADQFWIATAELPDAVNIITDFAAGEDAIGIAGLGIGFADVSITDLEGDALIAASDSDLAILQGVAAESLTADDFALG